MYFPPRTGARKCAFSPSTKLRFLTSPDAARPLTARGESTFFAPSGGAVGNSSSSVDYFTSSTTRCELDLRLRASPLLTSTHFAGMGYFPVFTNASAAFAFA